MDQNEASHEQPDEHNLFNPDNAVASDTAPTGAETPPEPESTAAPQPIDPAPLIEEPDMPVQPPSSAITWTASEFIAHHKSPVWYLLLAVAALVLAAAVWLFTKDAFSTAVVVVGAILLGSYAAHKPRQLAYMLDDYGLTIGQRHYGFGEFRSFSVVPEGAFSSIELTPLRRFAMFTTIYFDPTDEDRIVGLLSEHLPLEERSRDLIDQLMRRIRF